MPSRHDRIFVIIHVRTMGDLRIELRETDIYISSPYLDIQCTRYMLEHVGGTGINGYAGPWGARVSLSDPNMIEDFENAITKIHEYNT